jgi:uncharacterized membrane protein YfbV (UPF0208 family)
MWYLVILNTVKKMLLALLGEKIVAKVAFSGLDWLADQSETNIDNELVADWKGAYYGKLKETPETK